MKLMNHVVGAIFGIASLLALAYVLTNVRWLGFFDAGAPGGELARAMTGGVVWLLVAVASLVGLLLALRALR